MYSEKKLLANIKSFIRIFDFNNAIFQLFYLNSTYRIFIGIFLFENKEYIRSIAFLKTLENTPSKYYYLILNYIAIGEEKMAKKYIELLEKQTDFSIEENIDDFFIPYLFSNDLFSYIYELKASIETGNKVSKINNLKLAVKCDSFTALCELFKNGIELRPEDMSEILQPLYFTNNLNMEILRSESNPYKLAFLSKKYFDRKMFKETAIIHKHIIENFSGFTLFIEYFGISLYRLEKRCCLEKLGKYLMRNFRYDHMTYFIIGMYYKSRFNTSKAIMAFKKSLVIRKDHLVFTALAYEYRKVGNFTEHDKYMKFAKYFSINNN